MRKVLEKITSLDLRTYVVWLILVVAWNFGVPDALPIEDVLAAIVIGVIVHYALARIEKLP